MTLYRIYTDNGNRAGFWVQHRTWSDRCAFVSSINGALAGKLPGRAPAHDDAPVEAKCFDVRSGRELPPFALPPGGDKSFTTIAEPWWSRADA